MVRLFATCGMCVIAAATLVHTAETQDAAKNSLDPVSLVDCTEAVLQELNTLGGNEPSRPIVKPATVSSVQRQEVLRVASSWAHDNCYLPCAYAMCAALLVGQSNTIAVYIRPVHPDRRLLYPEATVLIDRESTAVVSGEMLHDGCGVLSGSCVPKDRARK